MIFSLVLLVSYATAFLALKRLPIPSSRRSLGPRANLVQHRQYGTKRFYPMNKVHQDIPQFTSPYSIKSEYMAEHTKVMSINPRHLSLRIDNPFESNGDIFDKSISYAPVDAFTPDFGYPFRVYRELLQKIKDMDDGGQTQIKITRWLQKYLYGMTESPSFLASKQHRALTMLLMTHFKPLLTEGIPSMRGVIVDEMVERSKDLILKDIAKGIRMLTPAELQVVKSKPLMNKLLANFKSEYSFKLANINEATFRPLVIKDDHEQAAFLQYRLCSVFTHALRRTSEDLKLGPQALLTVEILLLVENRCLKGLATSGMNGVALCPFVQAVSLTVGALLDVSGALEVREVEDIFNALSKTYTIQYQ